METKRDEQTVAPCLLDRAAMALARPGPALLALAFLLTPSCWLAAALNTGAAFLKIDSGARPAAMGGAYTAVAEDVNALYYNPGGLARLTKREFGATHTQWLLDSTFDFLGYAHPTKSGTFGLGMTRLATGATESRDANRQAVGGFQASDTALALGFSRNLKPGGAATRGGATSVGGTAKYLESRIGQYSAATMAFDLGAVHTFSARPMSVGVSILNLGKGMKFLDQEDPLPLTMSLGGSYRLAGSLQLAMDVRHEVYDRRTDVGLGSEYSLFPALALRMGYGSQFMQAAALAGGSPLGGLSGGLGLRLANYRADYTFAPFSQGLGNVQRISLGVRFK